MVELSLTPFLILGNKIDSQVAVSEVEVREYFGLSQTTGKGKVSLENIRPIEIFMCSVLMRQGYGEGIPLCASFSHTHSRFLAYLTDFASTYRIPVAVLLYKIRALSRSLCWGPLVLVLLPAHFLLITNLGLLAPIPVAPVCWSAVQPPEIYACRALDRGSSHRWDLPSLHVCLITVLFLALIAFVLAGRSALRWYLPML